MTHRDPAVCEAELEIGNRYGLHARAATVFVRTAVAFDAKVEVGKDGRWVDGRSILGLLTLAAGPESRIVVRTSGADADAALAALADLVRRRFDEDETA